MNSLVAIPACSTGDDDMTSSELMAVARAEQDWRDGLSADENPFPVGSVEYRHYQDQFDRLMTEEAIREQSAA